MTYDQVFSEDPPIIITEDDQDEYFHIYVEGDLVGICLTEDEAFDIANEVLDAIVGEELQEGDYL